MARRIPGGDPDDNVTQSGNLKNPLFFGLSLLLSLIIVVISVTVFIVAFYFYGAVDRNFFILFIIIIGINLFVAAISLSRLVKILVEFSVKREIHNIYVPIYKSGNEREQVQPGSKLNSRYFSESELNVIDLLKTNGNRMLQNAIVSATGFSKATTSRVITSLEKKGVIVRIRKGVTNEILLSETYVQ